MNERIRELARVECEKQLKLSPEKHAEDIVEQVVSYFYNPHTIKSVIEEHFGV